MAAPRKRSKAKGSKRVFWFKLFVVLTVVVLGCLVYLDAKVRYSLNERQWQLPARVYSRVLSLQPGKNLSAEDFLRELRQLGYVRNDSWRRPGTYTHSENTFWVSSRGYQSSGGAVNPLRFQLRFNGNTIERLETAGGGPLEGAQLEPLEIGSIYPGHQEDRLLVKLEEVPQSLREILLVIEDRDFYQHWGVSVRSIGRALVANFKAGRALQGGSTITQQLVKNVFLSSDRSLWRKGIEAIMAMLVELHFSKDEILESYINEVYLGQEGARAIHGFSLASWHYFNRPLVDLDAGQIALLVGMVKGPSFYDPWRNPKRALARRNLVLKVMAEQEMISNDQQLALQKKPITLAKANALANVYPAYLDLVRRQLRRDYSQKSLQTEGMKIFTAFDPLVQYHAETSMSVFMQTQAKPLEGAMVVTDVKTGDVLALVGGKRMRYAGFNRALDAVRPIGSLIKPAVYLSALQRPNEYTLASMISDGPVEVAAYDGSIWQPKNFDRTNHGEVLLHSALARSYNQATARLGMQVGLSEVISVVKQLGVQRSMRELPSVLLGAKGMSPIEVAGMYQTIASAGVYSPLRSIVDVADKQSNVLARYPVRQEQVVEKPYMHLLHYALVEVVQEGTGKGVYQKLPTDFLVAGKTGTTNDLRDSWFAGFAGDYLAVVWMGRDDNQSAGLTGSSGALKVWRSFFATASSEPLDFSVPPGIVYHWVDSETGLRSREICEGARYLPFVQGSAPTERSDCKRTLPGVLRWFKSLF